MYRCQSRKPADCPALEGKIECIIARTQKTFARKKRDDFKNGSLISALNHFKLVPRAGVAKGKGCVLVILPFDGHGAGDGLIWDRGIVGQNGAGEVEKAD